jgi:hypothetical protein
LSHAVDEHGELENHVSHVVFLALPEFLSCVRHCSQRQLACCSDDPCACSSGGCCLLRLWCGGSACVHAHNGVHGLACARVGRMCPRASSMLRGQGGRARMLGLRCSDSRQLARRPRPHGEAATTVRSRACVLGLRGGGGRWLARVPRAVAAQTGLNCGVHERCVEDAGR